MGAWRIRGPNTSCRSSLPWAPAAQGRAARCIAALRMAASAWRPTPGTDPLFPIALVVGAAEQEATLPQRLFRHALAADRRRRVRTRPQAEPAQLGIDGGDHIVAPGDVREVDGDEL